MKIGLDNLIDMLFNRTGGYMETSSTIIYWISPEGLSISYNLKMTIARLVIKDILLILC